MKHEVYLNNIKKFNFYPKEHGTVLTNVVIKWFTPLLRIR
jgi:hypothetical protein